MAKTVSSIKPACFNPRPSALDGRSPSGNGYARQTVFQSSPVRIGRALIMPMRMDEVE